MTSSPSVGPAVRGVVRLLNTAGGRLLCLAGDVDAATVDSFHQRYGREPARIDVIDVRSVTSLSREGTDLVQDHLSAAELANRPVAVRGSPLLRPLSAGATPRRGGRSR
jgi:hypothetical protein